MSAICSALPWAAEVAFWEATWFKVGVVIIGALVGGLVVGFLARGIMALLLRELSATALFRIRLLGGALGALLAYLFLGAPGFGPGEGGFPGQAPGSGDGRVASPTAVATSPEVTADEFKVRLVEEADYRKAGSPPNAFFAFESAPQTPVTAAQILDRIDTLLKEGRLKSSAKVVLRSPSENTTDPAFNPTVRELKDAIKQKGLRVESTSTN